MPSLLNAPADDVLRATALAESTSAALLRTYLDLAVLCAGRGCAVCAREATLYRLAIDIRDARDHQPPGGGRKP